MKKYIIPAAALIFTCWLSYRYPLTSFFLLGIVLLALVLLVMVAIIRFFKKINSRWTVVPASIIAICLASVAFSLLHPLGDAVLISDDTSKSLEFAYQKDQQDRMTVQLFLPPWKNRIRERDSVRLAFVNLAYSEGRIVTPADRFHAAFVFHHGHQTHWFEIAKDLASLAAAAPEFKNEYKVQWLAKAAYDRYMMSIGKPQKYNTQNRISIGSN